MKNPVFLMIAFVLALATAYAISQDTSSQRPVSTTQQSATSHAAISPSTDPLAVTPANQVQSEIENAMRRQSGLHAQAIQVKVDDETIELSGTVDSGKDKVTIYRLAESYATNRRVKDLVTVANRHPEQSGPASASNAKASENSEERSHSSESGSN